MTSTFLSAEATQRLRQGGTTAAREEILSVEGEPRRGEPVRLVGAEGRVLGLADLDLEAPVAVRRIGLPDDIPEGLMARQLRRAMERRGRLVEDPRYCRWVNDDGDGLPGLVVDRFERHFSVQTTSRAMDARLDEITRLLVEVAGASSVLLRNDSARRARWGLKPARSAHVLYGTPPRWSRLLELGARLSIDLHKGEGTGYSYALRELRRMVGRLSQGALVLDPSCLVGGTAVQAGLHGARRIVAFATDLEDTDLAQENVEANGLMSRAQVSCADSLEALRANRDVFDLVVLHAPARDAHPEEWARKLEELVLLSVRATRHGGLLVLGASGEALGAHPLEERVLCACEGANRTAYRLLRAGAPADFPARAGSPDELSAVALELS
ncbi:MAG: class I SAM-dependent rRNA methyltransferase [Myxococcaceae bacterium]